MYCRIYVFMACLIVKLKADFHIVDNKVVHCNCNVHFKQRDKEQGTGV